MILARRAWFHLLCSLCAHGHVASTSLCASVLLPRLRQHGRRPEPAAQEGRGAAARPAPSARGARRRRTPPPPSTWTTRGRRSSSGARLRTTTTRGDRDEAPRPRGPRPRGPSRVRPLRRCCVCRGASTRGSATSRLLCRISPRHSNTPSTHPLSPQAPPQPTPSHHTQNLPSPPRTETVRAESGVGNAPRLPSATATPLPRSLACVAQASASVH